MTTTKPIAKRMVRVMGEPLPPRLDDNGPIIAHSKTPDKPTRHDQFVRRKPQPTFVESVRRVVRDLKRGEVVSYGEVARRAGYPRAARAVGNVLASSLGLPWWRVIRASGELAAASREEQRRRLLREGVRMVDGRVKGHVNSGRSAVRPTAKGKSW